MQKFWWYRNVYAEVVDVAEKCRGEIQFRQGSADVRWWSGRPVVGRLVASGCPVPGRFAGT